MVSSASSARKEREQCNAQLCAPVHVLFGCVADSLGGYINLTEDDVSRIIFSPSAVAHPAINGSPGFSADDQIKTRAGTSLGTSTFSGTSWQGDLGQLAPGIGYEVKVSQAITFNYGV